MKKRYITTVNFLREFSIPLIAGVLVSLVWANADYNAYHQFLHEPLIHGFTFLGHPLTFHFIVNDLFMVLFFGIAAVEITEAVVLPDGPLNPISKAINPIMGTLGGVIGPVAVFFLLCYIFPISSLFTDGIDAKAVMNGWGIPTATDIALAWLVARVIFGSEHSAVAYLVLLAVADDAIGLGIIAVFYPDPNHPVEVYWLGLTILGMLLSYLMRRINISSMWAYLIVGGGLSWLGLLMAHLHPALALVFIIPFMPPPKHHHQKHLFDNEIPVDSALVKFEETFQMWVDFGLFGFGLANAGVLFSEIGQVTWIIFLSLLIGKTVGITLFGYIGQLMGFKLPDGMDVKTLVVAAMVAGVGLTVALFVAGEAYTDMGLQGSAKMGALFSSFIIVIAFVTGKILKIKRIDE